MLLMWSVAQWNDHMDPIKQAKVRLLVLGPGPLKAKVIWVFSGQNSRKQIKFAVAKLGVHPLLYTTSRNVSPPGSLSRVNHPPDSVFDVRFWWVLANFSKNLLNFDTVIRFYCVKSYVCTGKSCTKSNRLRLFYKWQIFAIFKQKWPVLGKNDPKQAKIPHFRVYKAGIWWFIAHSGLKYPISASTKPKFDDL